MTAREILRSRGPGAQGPPWVPADARRTPNVYVPKQELGNEKFRLVAGISEELSVRSEVLSSSLLTFHSSLFW